MTSAICPNVVPENVSDVTEVVRNVVAVPAVLGRWTNRIGLFSSNGFVRSMGVVTDEMRDRDTEKDR